MLTTPNDIFNPELNSISTVMETSEALSFLYSQVTKTHYLTLNDRQLIQFVLLQECVYEEESRIINRILYSVRRGWVKLVEDIHYNSVPSEAKRSLQIAGSLA